MKEKTWEAIKNGKKPWKTEEWKDRREEVLDKKGRECEWCGSKRNLAIHHSAYGYNKLSSFHKVAYNLFLESEWYKAALEKQKSEEGKYKKICPECKKATIYSRETKTPKWRCSSCKTTFSDPEKKLDKNRNRLNKEVFNRELRKFKKLNEERIREICEKRFKESMKEYFDMNSIVILCKKCHKAAENRKKLCQECGENYHSRKYDKCFECANLKECPTCGQNYYDPEKNDECSKCRNKIGKNFSVETGIWKCNICGWETIGERPEPPVNHVFEEHDGKDGLEFIPD